jgi:hypothetical protein
MTKMVRLLYAVREEAEALSPRRLLQVCRIGDGFGHGFYLRAPRL